jgi:acyl dehydratase
MPSIPTSADFRRYADMQIGLKEAFDYEITPGILESFLGAFGDYNPLHTDEEYARLSGFQGKVMHGSILNGFLSHFIGMRLPGKTAMLLSSDLRFSQPAYLGDRIRLEAEVTQKVDSLSLVVLRVTFHNLTQNNTAARGSVQSIFRENR